MDASTKRLSRRPPPPSPRPASVAVVFAYFTSTPRREISLIVEIRDNKERIRSRCARRLAIVPLEFDANAGSSSALSSSVRLRDLDRIFISMRGDIQNCHRDRVGFRERGPIMVVRTSTTSSYPRHVRPQGAFGLFFFFFFFYHVYL